MDTKNKPTPAQSREEEALERIPIIIDAIEAAVTSAAKNNTLYDGVLLETGDVDACLGALKAQLAALRSRQSPQAVAIDDIFRIDAVVEASEESAAKCSWRRIKGAIVAPRPSAAPQPSPQGEDAVAVSYPNPRELAVAFMSVMQSHTIRNGKVWEPVEQITAMLEHEFRRRDDALRARIASAQSSAQGEEARELREAEVGDLIAWKYFKDWHCGITDNPVTLEHIKANADEVIVVKARAALERKEGE